MILFLASTAVGLTQCSRTEAIAGAREQGRTEEAFRQLEVRTAGWERNHKAALASTKERLQQAIADVEARVTNGPMHELRARLDKAEADLSSRAGKRWNKPDQLEYESRENQRDAERELRNDKRFAKLENHVEVLRNRVTVDGFDRGKGEALTAHVLRVERALTAHIAQGGHPAMDERVKALVDVVARLRAYIARVEAKADANADEDFKRPEAEQMKSEILETLREMVSAN